VSLRRAAYGVRDCGVRDPAGIAGTGSAYKALSDQETGGIDFRQ
jgi:hypothetical protein